jgi:hypothetical protein
MTQYKRTHQHITTVQFINKLLIYIFGICGILLDSSVCYIISLTVWIWFIPCVNYEWKLIELFNKYIGSK